MASPNGSPSEPFAAGAGIEVLDQLARTVPGYEEADNKVWRKITRKSGYPNEYIEAAADAVAASEEVQRASRLDAEAARSGVKLSNEIRALIKKVESVLMGLRFTDAKLRASLVDACDQVYAIVPGIARNDKSLKPHIEAMHHATRRKGGKKKAEEPQPQPGDAAERDVVVTTQS